MTELDERFLVLAQTSSQLLQLVPSVLCSVENVELSSVTQLYAQYFTITRAPAARPV